MKRRLLILLLCLTGLSVLPGEIRFADPKVSEPKLLLFEVRSESPRWGTHDTLFIADLETRDLTQLTFFPERLTYLSGKKVLQIQNRFGVFHSWLGRCSRLAGGDEQGEQQSNPAHAASIRAMAHSSRQPPAPTRRAGYDG